MKSLLVFSFVAAIVLSLNACNRNSIDPASDGSARLSGPNSSTATGPRSSTAGGPHSLTDVAVSSLSATITAYISTNYAGATIKDAKKDAQGNYLVAITINSTVSILVFKADGTFVKELTPKVKPKHGDSTGHPKKDSLDHPKPTPGDTAHHAGPGRGKGPGAILTDVAVSSLPAAITTYVTANYAGAIIEKAGKDTNTGDYLVMVKTADSKRVLLIFGSDGTFKKAVTGK